MHADNFVVDYSCARQTVERVAELFPHLYRKPAAAFVIETVNSIDPGTLMISSQQEKILWILNFVCKKEAYDFQRLFASVHIIAQKQIVGLHFKAEEVDR